MVQQAFQNRVQDNVPANAPGSQEIGFRIADVYNASELLFSNLTAGRSDKVAVYSPTGNKTYADLCVDASRFANAFRSLGLTPGERVLLFLDDTPAYPAAFFGAMRVGLVPLLINTLTPPDLLNFYLTDSGARAAVVEAAFAERFTEAATAGTQLATIVVANGNAPEGRGIVSAEGWLAAQAAELVPEPTHRNDMAFWQYSSGSTGRPKGIVHLHHDMAYTELSFSRHILKLSSDDICYSVPKIFFAYGLGNSITFPFSVGAACVLVPGQPRPSTVFSAIAEYKPTVFFGLPTLYTSLTKAPEAGSAKLSSLRMCLSAAEVLSADVFDSWKALSGLEIIEGLGSTEVLHIYLSNTNDAKRLSSAGRRVPGYEISLRDPDGNEVPEGDEGVLWVRGDSNSPFYWNRPDKTAETMKDEGWIYTGDRLKRDADGFYYFRGRADDLVKISGQWVYPLEVELCMAEHPCVHECAVLALPLPDQRMTLKAYVVRSRMAAGDDNQLTLDLQNHVKTQLLPYKYPRTIEFVDSLQIGRAHV